MNAVIILYRAVAVAVDLFLAALALYAFAWLLRWALCAVLDRFTRKYVPPLPRRKRPAPYAAGEPLSEDEERALEGIAKASADEERETS